MSVAIVTEVAIGSSAAASAAAGVGGAAIGYFTRRRLRVVSNKRRARPAEDPGQACNSDARSAQVNDRQPSIDPLITSTCSSEPALKSPPDVAPLPGQNDCAATPVEATSTTNVERALPAVSTSTSEAGSENTEGDERQTVSVPADVRAKFAGSLEHNLEEVSRIADPRIREMATRAMRDAAERTVEVVEARYERSER